MLNTLPDLHRSFAEQLKLKLQSDSRIHSLSPAARLSMADLINTPILDFVVVIDPLIMTKSWLSVWRSPERSAICYMLSPGNTSVSLAC